MDRVILTPHVASASVPAVAKLRTSAAETAAKAVRGELAAKRGQRSEFAVNFAAMMPIDEFKRRVDAMAREMHESPLAEGADRVYLSGEIEWERHQSALVAGILLPEDVRLTLAELSRELRIKIDR